MIENKYLVTGALGFIGFNFIQYLVENIKVNPEHIISVDCITYAAEYMLDKKLKYFKDYNIINYEYDIYNDTDKIKTLIGLHGITYIINFAARFTCR